MWLLYEMISASWVIAVIAAESPRLWRRSSGEPGCGRCGYAVRGLSTFNCPECGSDLREVGINIAAADRGAAHRRQLYWRLLAWTIVWFVLTLILAW